MVLEQIGYNVKAIPLLILKLLLATGLFIDQITSNTFAITLRAILHIFSIYFTTIESIIVALCIIKFILTHAICKKGIVVSHLSNLLSKTFAIIAILCIDAGSTTVATIKITFFIVSQILAKTVSDPWIYCYSTTFTDTFRAFFSVHTWATTVTPIKVAMSVIGPIMAIPVPNKISQLTL